MCDVMMCMCLPRQGREGLQKPDGVPALHLAVPDLSSLIYAKGTMTAAETVPYQSQNDELLVEVERLRAEVAQREGARTEVPDHRYDRCVRRPSICKIFSSHVL